MLLTLVLTIILRTKITSYQNQVNFTKKIHNFKLSYFNSFKKTDENIVQFALYLTNFILVIFSLVVNLFSERVQTSEDAKVIKKVLFNIICYNFKYWFVGIIARFSIVSFMGVFQLDISVCLFTFKYIKELNSYLKWFKLNVRWIPKRLK